MKKTILFIFLVSAIGNVLFAQTTIAISNTVINANALGFGLNWAEGNANRNLNALNNHTGDAGFGRQIIRFKGVCDGGSATYLEHASGTTNDYYETLYTGMFDGGQVSIYRETPTDIILIRTDSVFSFLADTLPNHHRIIMGAGPVVMAGDIYVVSIEANKDLNQYCHPRLTWIRNGNNTWDKRVNDQFGLGNALDVSKELTTDVPTNGGTTACKISNTNPNNIEVGIGQYFSTDTAGGEFALDPNKTYRFTVWMKQTGIANGAVTLNTNTTNIKHTFTVGNTWQQFTFDTSGVMPPNIGSPFDLLQLTFNGTGTLFIDNFTCHDVAYPLLSLLPNIKQELINFVPQNLRIWSGHTNTELGTNISDWTDNELQSAKVWGVNGGPTAGSGLKLPIILPICEENNIAPYLICSPAFNAQDILGLMEYLAGPTTTTYGAKRLAQGHSAPYTNTINKFYIELGNETWNGLFAPWTYDFNAALYGKFSKYFFDIVKSSPYYDATKFELMIGGFFVQPDEYGYGQGAIKNAPDGKNMMVANYIGGFDGLNLPPSPTLADTMQQTAFYAPWITRTIIDQHIITRNNMANNGYPYTLGVYEAGPGYALPNPNFPFDLKAEAIGKSLANAVANLDAFLYQSQKGFGVQDLFLFARGYNWSSHTAETQGLRPHNHFLALQMRNRYAKGQMITSTVSNSPTTYLPLIDGNNNQIYDTTYGEAAAGNYENIASYAFRNGADEYAIFVLNRNITTNTPITITLPSGASMDSLQVYKLSGDPMGSNIGALNYQIVNQNLTNSIIAGASTYSYTMPAGSIYLFTTKKTEIPAPLSVQQINLIAQEACCNTTILKWRIQAFEKIKNFEIQQSADGLVFEKVGEVANNVNSNQYTFADTKSIQTENYYRIKMIAIDNTFYYSNIANIKSSKDADVIISPNPFTDFLELQLKNTSVASVAINDAFGRIIKNIKINKSCKIQTNNLVAGIYMVSVTLPNNCIYYQKLVKH